MKRTLTLGIGLVALTLAVFTLPASPALADHDEIGGVYKPAGHTAICMIRCDNGPCTIRLRMKDENGNTVASQNFFNVPENGSRMLIYGGPKKLLGCFARDNSTGVSDLGWAIVDSNWHTVALANQDD